MMARLCGVRGLLPQRLPRAPPACRGCRQQHQPAGTASVPLPSHPGAPGGARWDCLGGSVGVSKGLSTTASPGVRASVSTASQKDTPRAAAAAAGPPVIGKQPVDYTTVVASVAELNRDWIPAKIEQAIQVDRFTLVLRLRTLEGGTWLYLSRHETGCHMAVGDSPARGSSAEAFSFGEQVHQTLRGLVLLGVSIPFPWERCIKLDLADRIGTEPSHSIYFEVTGRYSNIVLTDSSKSVVTAAFQLGSKMSSVRAVRAGDQYVAPPMPPGIAPQRGQASDLWRQTVEEVAQVVARQRGRDGRVSESLVRGWQGVSPSLAKEICAKAGVAPDTDVQALLSEDWVGLHDAWEGWLLALEEGNFNPTICLETGAYSVLGAYPTPAAGGSLHALLRGYYANIQGGQQFSQMRASVQSAVKAATKKANTKLAQLTKQTGTAGQDAEVQKMGDLLMANVHRCEPGMASVEVEDWETGEMVTIALDPSKSAVEVAEGFYRRAGKMRRSVDQVVPLIDKAEQEIEYLADVEEALSQLATYQAEDDLYTLLEIRDELVAARYMRPPPEASLEGKGASKARKAQKKGKAKAAEGSPREYLSPSGLRIYVGRNNKQNDQMTRAAAETDLWLHARGVPGSHVVVKVPPSTEPSDNDKTFAANLAAYFSKARNSGRVEVICVDASNVKRPKGAAPGRVALLREDVVMGRPGDSPAAAEE